MRRDLGDFQTPPALVAEVLETLGAIGDRWPRVLEPTCGRGHFIAGLLATSCPPREIHGIEIQESHYQVARTFVTQGQTAGVHVHVGRADLFDMDFARDLAWRERGPLLVIGNPPWVTNSELGTLASKQRPPRRNLKGLRGIEALTGSSNFDITEAIWIKLAFELVDQQPTIALLCKTSVARNALQFANRAGLPVASASIRRIDAARWFSAAVDACLFCATIGINHPSFPPLVKGGPGGVGPRPPHAGHEAEDLIPALAITPPPSSASVPTPAFTSGGKLLHLTDHSFSVPVYTSLSERLPASVMGFARGGLVADSDEYANWSFADGICPIDWRQGLKHDAAAVMELTRDPVSGDWRNRHGEAVDVEADCIYPLVKGTDLTRAPGERPERAILLTQKSLGEDTSLLAVHAPRLWNYLHSHADAFSRRKSSIYRGRPPFSLFGIGPYSFAPFKVAISGMHKNPRFRVLGPVQGRPVMLDDTCYFLACETAAEASILIALCSNPIALGLIASLIFRDAKRPITKKLLQRIDLLAVLRQTDRGKLLSQGEYTLNNELERGPGESLPDVVASLEHRFARNGRSVVGIWTEPD